MTGRSDVNTHILRRIGVHNIVLKTFTVDWGDGKVEDLTKLGEDWISASLYITWLVLGIKSLVVGASVLHIVAVF